MPRKFLAVIGGNRKGLVAVRLEQLYGGIADNVGMFAVDFFNQGELGFALNNRYQCTLVILAYHRVDFPATNPRFVINNGGAFVNADAVCNLAALVFRAVFLAAFFARMAQVQVAAIAFIRPGMLIMR